jgi:hypothetical protein
MLTKYEFNRFTMALHVLKIKQSFDQKLVRYFELL